MQRIYRAAFLSLLALPGCASLSRFMVYPRAFSSFYPCAEAEAAGAAFVNEGGLRYIHARAKNPKALLLFFHGNGNGACERAELIRPLLDMGCDVALAEYPGYSGGNGETSQDLILSNALAVYDRLAAAHPALPLIPFGESLGTGVATYVAQSRQAEALILQSPYTSVEDVGASTYWFLPVRWMLTEKFPAKDWARGVASPVLVIYAIDDWVVPARFSEAQVHNFKGPVQLERLEDAGHNNMRQRQKKRYYNAVERFVNRVALCQ